MDGLQIFHLSYRTAPTCDTLANSQIPIAFPLRRVA